MPLNNSLRAFAITVALSSCTPTACNEEERVVDREVEVLVGQSGPAVQEAKRRLVARGRESIAILETGLYEASAIGRVRIVDTLKELKLAEARPILQHLVERDADELVRERADEALQSLPAAPTR